MRSPPCYSNVALSFRNVSLSERGGVSMVLMKKGEVVVDLWAGYADPLVDSQC